MKLPVFIKIILNVIFYVLYLFIVSIVFSLIIGFLLNHFDKQVIVDGTITSYLIQLALMVFVLFITVVYRKYFYIPLECDKCNSKKTEVKNKNIESLKSENDELDILVAKEK